MTAPTGGQPGEITYTQQPPEEMTYEEYVAAVAAVTAALAATILAISLPFQAIALTRADWMAWLAATYPYVEDARRQIAELSRRFYDSERAKHVGPVRIPILDGFEVIGPDGRPIRFEDSVGLTGEFWERLNIILAPYHPDWYQEAMEAVYEQLAKPETSDGELAQVINATIKEAENGGRRTNMWAVDDDPVVIGWARVQGGEDSCGFCAMLISRGPVYRDDPTSRRSAPTRAGLEVEDESLAVEIWRQAQATGDDSELNALMNRWHPNCDCKVVPVFKLADWPGRDHYLEMLEAWKAHAKGDSPKERFNAFRRYIERGRHRENVIRFPTAA